MLGFHPTTYFAVYPDGSGCQEFITLGTAKPTLTGVSGNIPMSQGTCESAYWTPSKKIATSGGIVQNFVRATHHVAAPTATTVPVGTIPAGIQVFSNVNQASTMCEEFYYSNHLAHSMGPNML